MTDFVRVKDNRTGHHYTVSALHAEMNKQHLAVLKDAPAVDVNGRPKRPTSAMETKSATVKKEK